MQQLLLKFFILKIKKCISFIFQNRKHKNNFFKRKIDINEKEVTKTKSYKSKLTNCIRCMASSLSNLVDNHAEGIHKSKSNYKHDNKKVKNANLNTKIVNAILNIQMLKMIYIQY